MEMRHPADYAYHNCEFHSAIALIGQTGTIYEDLAVIHIKSLCELDLATHAVSQADRYLESYPDSGHLHYLLGMAKYLVGSDLPAIESSFLTATELGFSGGPIGLAFVEFAKANYERAIALASQQVATESEMAHIQCLILCQLHIASGSLDEAEHWLQRADRVLKDQQSQLRQYWGQLCWVRLLRAKNLFESAQLVITKLLELIDEQHMPRIWRNALEANRMISVGSSAANIITPRKTASPNGLHSEALPAEITSRPMLLAFYEYLSKCGQRGATKELLAEHVWEESYNPTIHDTRIYKTVARLRRVLGDNNKNPTKLLQVGRQYLLCPTGINPTAGEVS